MSQVGITVDSGTADIHAYKWRVDGLKFFFFPGKGIVEFEIMRLHKSSKVRITNDETRYVGDLVSMNSKNRGKMGENEVGRKFYLGYLLARFIEGLKYFSLETRFLQKIKKLFFG